MDEIENDPMNKIMTEFQRGTVKVIVEHLQDLLSKLSKVNENAYSMGVKDGIQSSINLVNGINDKIK